MAQTTVLTDEGLSIWDANSPGTIQATALKIKLGRAQRMPMVIDTDLSMPFVPAKEFDVSNVEVGVAANASRLYFAATDVSDDLYDGIGEIGLFYDDAGTEKLFAYSSDPDGPLPYTKTATQAHTYRFQLNLNRTGTGQSPIASSAMSLFPATEQVHGLVRYGTDAQRDGATPPEDRVLSVEQVLELLNDLVRFINGNPTNRQIIDYDAPNSRLRFLDLMTALVAAINGNPTDGQIIDYDDANSRLRFLDLMTALVAAINGNPTDGQIIDYDAPNSRLRFLDLMTALVAAINGNPTDGQIIDYDDGNSRLRFRDKPVEGITDGLVFNANIVTNNNVLSSVQSASESLASRKLIAFVWYRAGNVWSLVVPGAAWDAFASTDLLKQFIFEDGDFIEVRKGPSNNQFYIRWKNSDASTTPTPLQVYVYD